MNFSETAKISQLYFNERQGIAAKANGDKKAEERLIKAICFEVKCWAQFPLKFITIQAKLCDRCEGVEPRDSCKGPLKICLGILQG